MHRGRIAGEALSLGEDPTEGFGWASFTGKATYREPGWLDAVGNYYFLTYVEDRNEPGTGVDRFWLQVADPTGALVAALSLPAPAWTGKQSLRGGNIVVPHTRRSE